jgi:tetratricopeptide (TPR) repeat protein
MRLQSQDYALRYLLGSFADPTQTSCFNSTRFLFTYLQAQAIALNPNAAVAYKNRADARSPLGDSQGAIEDYTQALKINPNYAMTYKIGEPYK